MPAGAGRKNGKKKAKSKQLPSDDYVPFSSSGVKVLHHTGESNTQYHTPNHAVQSQSTSQILTTIQLPSPIESLTAIQLSQLPTTIQSPTAIHLPYHH